MGASKISCIILHKKVFRLGRPIILKQLQSTLILEVCTEHL